MRTIINFLGPALLYGLLQIPNTAQAQTPVANAGATLTGVVKADYDRHLGELFRHFHANPELSFVENKTADRIAKELSSVGFEVTSGVGKTGLVALMKNGSGPLVMMRADMDGLPVEELTNLPYASKVTQQNSEGQEFPVMHACGHDVHITSLVGTARRMAALKDSCLLYTSDAADE